ncbi:TonB-dependent receptor [Brevundimonas aurifodinae]|uniref:TonB-dependent receptor n=1 Tax=Brevundimonas aurifodinae TaxID=1508312 RepID=A0ABV1NLG4_9CAUL
MTSVSIAVLALAASPTWAQTVQDPETSTVEDIVVTAQRRAENLQDVPVAVTALSSETLLNNDIRDLSRVEVLTPGFSFGRSGSDARPAIRGARTENVSVSGDPSIGFFSDNVYRSRASQANEPFVDVERVEIQRGPQGTLYGRNTFGGNIAITTNDPDADFDAGLSATVGSFDRRQAEGFVNIPLNDMLQVRIAGLRETMDGYVRGATDELDLFDRDTSYGRIGVRFAPTPQLEAVLRYSLWKEQGTGGGAFGYRVGGSLINPTTGNFDLNGQPYAILYDIPRTGRPLVEGFPLNPDPLFYAGNTKVVQDLRQEAFSANLSYDAGPVTLRSITGYIDYSVFRNADGDFSARVGNIDGQEDQLESFSQEFQIASNGDGPFSWIAGYFYFNEDVTASFFSSCPTGAQNTPGCAFAAGLPETTSNAVFGQASYWIIPDRLRITGGLRYTEDEKTIRRATATTNGSQRITSVTPTGQEFDFMFEETTWRANVEYHLADQNLIYGTVSTGFRSGGFNSGFFTNPAIPASFGPETVTAYEIGSKNQFWDNRVRLNISAYRNEFEDLQVQNQILIVTPTVTTTASVILNAAEAYSQGIEVEFEAVPMDNLNLAFSATLMEAKFEDYRNVPAPANYTGLQDYSGNDIPYSPNIKLTGQVSYDFDLGANGTLTPQATVLYSGDYQLTDTNTVLDRQDSFAKLDLRLSWEDVSRRYRVDAFVNNVTDEITLNRATFGSRGILQSYDAPRMYGLRLGIAY